MAVINNSQLKIKFKRENRGSQIRTVSQARIYRLTDFKSYK
jgi:hypothetical protein